MSEEQLSAFLEAAKADAGLQEQLKAAGDADAVVAIAKAAGFVIAAEELKSAQAEISDECTEISDEELEGVAGGTIALLVGKIGEPSYGACDTYGCKNGTYGAKYASNQPCG